ncbi:MAG: regulatory protein GemA [Campylobacter sp.]|nr:regulatory protein GemA [Campylobacter sp.]
MLKIGKNKENELKKYYIKMIHTLKHNYFIDDECRKIYLQSRYGKDSLTKLNIEELREVLKLVGYKFGKKQSNTSINYKERVAKKDNASKRQIAMIYGLWSEVARDKSEMALRNFINRITHKTPLYLWYLSRKEASNVILALRNMAKKANDECR